MVSQCKIARHGLTLQSQWLSALHSITQLQSLKVVIVHWWVLFTNNRLLLYTGIIWDRFFALNSITDAETEHTFSLRNNLFVGRQNRGKILNWNIWSIGSGYQPVANCFNDISTSAWFANWNRSQPHVVGWEEIVRTRWNYRQSWNQRYWGKTVVIKYPLFTQKLEEIFRQIFELYRSQV